MATIVYSENRRGFPEQSYYNSLCVSPIWMSECIDDENMDLLVVEPILIDIIQALHWQRRAIGPNLELSPQ